MINFQETDKFFIAIKKNYLGGNWELHRTYF